MKTQTLLALNPLTWILSGPDERHEALEVAAGAVVAALLPYDDAGVIDTGASGALAHYYRALAPEDQDDLARSIGEHSWRAEHTRFDAALEAAKVDGLTPAEVQDLVRLSARLPLVQNIALDELYDELVAEKTRASPVGMMTPADGDALSRLSHQWFDPAQAAHSDAYMPREDSLYQVKEAVGRASRAIAAPGSELLAWIHRYAQRPHAGLVPGGDNAPNSRWFLEQFLGDLDTLASRLTADSREAATLRSDIARIQRWHDSL
jgi:hypothetical protein